ncbi:MAG: 7-cyano-7-deazaguanine synthase QueC [Gemmatimonadales bacterium]
MTTGPRAVVLLSGGMDSATALAVAISRGFLPHALTFRYGQRHVLEIEAARRVARAAGVAEHVVVDIDLRAIGGSALTADFPVPRDRPVEDIGRGIPITYVPARNTVFLSFALGLAEVLEASDIFIGVNALDYSGYPDCRPEFIAAFERLANVATRAGVEGRAFQVHAPLLELDKAGIIRLGTGLGVDYALTLTCYDPTPAGLSCGRCDACRLRLKGFREAGLVDPVAYQAVGPAGGQAGGGVS